MSAVRRKAASTELALLPSAEATSPAKVTVLNPIGSQAIAELPTRELAGVLHVLTCGSVDDGKSTLIGRLLWDAGAIYDDQREAIARAALKTGKPDYSLLVDGLVAEREQGITIDIAWRYLDTQRRRIVVIDSPGHEQYTRNMASGASNADVAIMLVDARSGVKRQTRRHAAILDLMGVRHVVLAVNKMDLVGWDETVYRRIAADFQNLTAGFGFKGAFAIPVSAPGGDNVASRSRSTPWYDGPTLIEHLDAVPSRVAQTTRPFRMAVQTVLRDGQDFRGLAGTVNAGRVCVGDRVVDILSGQSSRVLRIATMDRDLEIASTGQAVAIQLEHDLDIARGAILSGSAKPPAVAQRISSRLVWLSETPFDRSASYLLRTATDLVTVTGIEIEGLLDLESMETTPATAAGLNDIALAHVTLSRPVAVDRFADCPATGNVMLVDALTGASLAGGVVYDVLTVAATRSAGVLASKASSEPVTRFELTRSLLAGLNSDLDETPAARTEAERRAAEVVKLFAAAGIDARFVR